MSGFSALVRTRQNTKRRKHFENSTALFYRTLRAI